MKLEEMINEKIALEKEICKLINDYEKKYAGMEVSMELRKLPLADGSQPVLSVNITLSI